jgi:N-acetylglucosaminyldiphosphoundecaprenol N-acetyl-beta-D-mannosaminyltransferase
MECYRHLDLRTIYNASGLTTPDGMPLVWLAHLKGYSDVSRVYGPDLMLALCEHSIERGYAHYFYGGSSTTLEQLVANLTHHFPGLKIAGIDSPPYRPLTPDEDAKIVDKINAANPDILWVGLGAPKQERWMAAHIDRLCAPALIGVGAAFDFHAGLKPQAPRWMQQSGLEWFFRLINEPRRLWRRYLTDNPLFVALVLLQMLGIIKPSLTRSLPDEPELPTA